jgi:nucleoside 2-deoxyribosyltransferase
MNRLKGTRCYLAGAIEKAPDNGTPWRDMVKSDLHDLGIIWLDPCDKPISGFQETPELHAKLKRHREDGFDRGVRDIMNPICKIDLRLVDISDFLIVNVDPLVPTFGTHEEISRASGQNKPVLLRIEGGKKCAPLWWYERMDSRLFFGEWSDLYHYLGFVAETTMTEEDLMLWSDYKWMFFRWMGE